ncbi:MAG: MerR family DNA-binding transcriptional regulator [Endozoicomonadaceae bacterium]|nr:MerR family DNA-binding transcriptional regulator [Endozoicomonadaceae bacterium]
MSQTYTISELAREFDITTRAIRFYEEHGLLFPERQRQSRVYSQGDKVRLKLVLRGKRLGFSLDESKELFKLYDPQNGNEKQLFTMLNKIAVHRSALEQQRHDIQIMQHELDDAEQHCREALKQSVEKTAGSEQ